MTKLIHGLILLYESFRYSTFIFVYTFFVIHCLDKEFYVENNWLCQMLYVQLWHIWCIIFSIVVVVYNRKTNPAQPCYVLEPHTDRDNVTSITMFYMVSVTQLVISIYLETNI